MSNLIKENANLQKQLQGANKQYYEDLLVYVRLNSMGKNYGQKNSWRMLFAIGGIFVINCLLFVFVRTPWVIPLSRWMTTVLAIILVVSVYLLNRDKNFGGDHGKKET